MTEADSKQVKEIQDSRILGNHEDVIWLLALVEAQEAEVELRGFKISNIITERDVANAEIERLKFSDHEHLALERDYRTRLLEIDKELTAAKREIERLKLRLIVMVRPPLVIEPDETESQLTDANGEIQQLQEEKSELMLKVTGLRTTCSNQGKQLTAANAEIDRLKTELDDQQISYVQLADETVGFKSQLTTAKESGLHWFNKLAEAKGEVEKLKREIVLTNEARDASAKTVKSQFDQLTAERGKAKKLRGILVTHIEALRRNGMTSTALELDQTLADTEEK